MWVPSHSTRGHISMIDIFDPCVFNRLWPLRLPSVCFDSPSILICLFGCWYIVYFLDLTDIPPAEGNARPIWSLLVPCATTYLWFLTILFLFPFLPSFIACIILVDVCRDIGFPSFVILVLGFGFFPHLASFHSYSPIFNCFDLSNLVTLIIITLSSHFPYPSFLYFYIHFFVL